MTLDLLQHYNGAPVRIMLDGAPALALLFLEVECARITSLCFLERSRRCPLLRHELTPEEIATIAPVSRNELKSTIELSSVEERSPEESQCRVRDELAELEERLQMLIKESSRISARAVELRKEARRSIRACQQSQEQLRKTMKR